MKNRTIFASGLAAFVAAMVFAGCAATAPAPEKVPEEVLKDGMVKMADLTSYKYDVSMKGDMEDPVSGDVKFDVKMNGSVDVKDMKNPKVSVKLDGSAEDGTGMSGSMKAEFMMNKQAVYFNLMNLDLGEEGLLPPDVTDYMSKWWMIALPEGFLDEMEEASGGVDMDNAEFKKVLEDSKVFATPEYVGSESVMGDPSWHYKVNIDKKAFLQFAREASEAQGETVSDAEFAEAEAVVENVDIKGDVWVSSTSNVINKFVGSVDFEGGEGEASGTLDMEFMLGDINKPVNLNIPSGAEEFPVEAVLEPLQMMGSMGDSSMMYDDSMYGDDMMMTDEELEAAMADLEGMEDMQMQ